MSASELVDMSLQRIKEVEDDVQAFITIDEEGARQKAKQLDEASSDGHSLFAMPNGIKDNLVTKGLKTTCASNMLKNFTDPLYTATAVKKLKEAQSIVMGKLNMDEFAMGSTTESSYFQVTRNPWNTDYVPGGSSGGSAAAVAAGEVLFSLGSDTGGSIRQPASFCGIVGMKPTYGLVSRFGLVAFASSLDQIGPITRSVEDNARILEVLAGHDPNDSTSAHLEVPKYTDALKEGIKGLRIAVPKQFIGDGVSEEVKESVRNALQMFELLSATWEEVNLPHLTYGDAAYYIIAI